MTAAVLEGKMAMHDFKVGDRRSARGATEMRRT